MHCQLRRSPAKPAARRLQITFPGEAGVLDRHGADPAPRARSEVPYQREAEVVLAMWREVERNLDATDPGSPEADALIADAARLRDEYQRLVKAAIEHDRPVPPEIEERPSST
jgi:hypothetical protein